MATVRRVYIYLVSAISLQSATWALIALLRNFLITRLDPDVTALAFQIAVLIVGLPIFLVHWLWAQRLVSRDREEQEAALRRFYLYGTLAGFLSPWITNLYDFIGSVLKANGSLDRLPNGLSATDGIFYHLIALIILGVMWFYHQRVLADDQKNIPDRERNSTTRRLYVLGFSLAGLFATGLAVIHLIRWIMFQFGSFVVSSGLRSVILTDETTRLLVGIPLWFIFWRWAKKLFETGGEEEQESALRKFYLYGTVFYSTVGVVANSAGILAGLFRRMLSLPPEGNIRGPLPIIIGLGAVWAYHAFVLRNDAKLTEAPRQAGIRRLYLYLIAFVGLCALLTGIVGDLNVLLRAFDRGAFGTELREQLAVFTAALLTGLPVWIIPWFRAQAETSLPGTVGIQARQSLVRKIYVYFFLFIGTMTILSTAVFILYSLFLNVLGENPPTFVELAQAFSYGLIAIGVLVYHSLTLRGDGQSSKQARTMSLASLRILVLDAGDGKFGTTIANSLNEENPGLHLAPVLLNPASDGTPAEDPLFQKIQEAGVIVAPWTFALPSGGVVHPAISNAIAASPARKLLIPTNLVGWDWAGVDRWSASQLTQQTLRALQQILEGEPVKAHRPMGVGSIIAIIIGILFLLGIILSLIGPFLFRM